MFLDFLFALRRNGVPVGSQEWLALHRALRAGLIGDERALYGLGRALLVHDEAHFDAFDLSFLEVFEGAAPADLSDALKRWLDDPVPMQDLDPRAFERATGMSLEELRRRFEELLDRQDERHDGGDRWIGTGGTSPFGNSGRAPAGFRLQGEGGGRSAVGVAALRRYRNYRSDVPIDVRQFKVALRALRNLEREGPPELAIGETVRRSCDNGGEIEIVLLRERKNTVRLALLMDAGGSMAPYARLVDRLFTAASEISHWRSFKHYFFHNCVYSRIYENIERLESVQTAELFRRHPPETKVVFVGDACMAPWELTATGGILSLWEGNRTSGLDWLRRFGRTWKDTVWLNPEPLRYWHHETIAAIGRVIPMFPLTLDGLGDAVRHLRRGAAARAR